MPQRWPGGGKGGAWTEALSALLFFYREVLHQDLGGIRHIPKRSNRCDYLLF